MVWSSVIQILFLLCFCFLRLTIAGQMLLVILIECLNKEMCILIDIIGLGKVILDQL